LSVHPGVRTDAWPRRRSNLRGSDEWEWDAPSYRRRYLGRQLHDRWGYFHPDRDLLSGYDICPMPYEIWHRASDQPRNCSIARAALAHAARRRDSAGVE